jgi:hypothetical protein
MGEEIAHKTMCTAEQKERPPEKPPVEKPVREAEKVPGRKKYPAFEPPEPWPEPPSKPDKKG